MPLEPDINLLPKDLRDKKLASKSYVFDDEKKAPAFDLNLSKDKIKAPILQPLKINIDQSLEYRKNSPQKSAPSPVTEKPQKKQELKADVAQKIGIMSRLKKMSFKDIANHLFHPKNEPKKTEDENDDVLGVELLPEEYASVRSARPEIIKLALIICVFAVFYGSLRIYYEVRLKSIQSAGVEFKKDIELLDGKIAEARDREAIMKDSIQIITTVNTLLMSRSDWVRFFDRLEELTLKQVYYTTLKTDNGESIKLIARALTLSDSLLQIDVFKQQKDFIKKVEIEDFKVQEEEVTVAAGDDSGGAPSNSIPVSYSSSYVEFPISITLEPKWFTKE